MPVRTWTILFVGLGLLVASSLSGCWRTRAVPGAQGQSPPPIYIADWANHRIVRMDDMDGSNWMTLGSEGSGVGTFSYPVGVCVDTAGRIYVTEQRHQRVLRLGDMNGANWTTFGARGNEPKQINRHMGSWIFVDDSGHIYLTYDGSHRLVRMDDMNGTNWTTFGSEGRGPGQFRYPAGVWVDGAGRIYVADFDNFRIVRMDDMQGTNWTAFGSYGSGPGQFINPCGICVDGAGRIYVTDMGNDRIVRLDDMSGANWTALGSFGTGADPGQLYAPCGVCVDEAGRIYVSQCSSNHRLVRMDDMSGANWKTLGAGGTGRGEFTSPMGIFVRARPSGPPLMKEEGGRRKDEQRGSASSFLLPPSSGLPAPLSIRAAIAKSLPLLQSGAKTFMELSDGKCISCHHQGLILDTVALARERGFAVDEQLEQAQVERVHGYYARRRTRYLRGLQDPAAQKVADPFGNFTVSVGYWLSGYAAERGKPDDSTSIAALLLASKQWPDGHWDFDDMSRVPMLSSDFTTTALAVNVLQKYGPKEAAAALAQSLARAKTWLVTSLPKTTDDKAYRLLGLTWSQAGDAIVHEAVAALLAEQRADGGWAQQDNMPSDVYATGLVLVALHRAGGLPVTAPAYQRGVAYLLQAQQADGSWFVKTRAIPSNPYFESGFPYAKSQFISYAGSCWATMALTLTIDPGK
jgi:DNA-binding beta-propeller fold protein YncE